jgi:hypothetical protein
MKKYKLKWFRNNGSMISTWCDTQEQLVSIFRTARQHDGGNWRQYSLDSGKTWIAY